MAKKQTPPDQPENIHTPDQEDLIAELRDKMEQSESESAPKVRGSWWAPKEMGGRTSTWIVRSMILILLLIIAAESYVIYGKIQEKPDPGRRGVPTIELVPAPEISGAADETVEIVPYPADDAGDIPAPPTPTPLPLPPWPEDLDVEISPPEQ